MIKNGFRVERQKAVPVVYEDIVLDCGYRLDIIVNEKIIIELKSIETINKIHLAQMLSYLKLSNLKLGLIINFNVLKLVEGIKDW